MKSLNYSKGRIGEEAAKNYLKEKGFVFIESNFRTDSGEIDLIMSDVDWLVFIEVKYKQDVKMGIPEEMINKRKVAQIKRLGQLYLLKNRLQLKKFIKYRIDGVCILGNQIRYYKNIDG